MKVFYEVSDNDGPKTIMNINNFHKLGKKKHLKVFIYGRSGKEFCMIYGDKAKKHEECAVDSHDMINARIRVTERRQFYTDVTVFDETLAGLNDQTVNLHFAWKTPI